MKSNVIKDSIHEVRVIETDKAAVSAAIRRLELIAGVIFAIYLAVAIYAFCIYAPLSHSPLFHKVLAVLIVISIVILGILHFVGPIFLRRREVLIGDDFIAGPDPGSFLGHKTLLDYGDILQVSLDISKCRITGATVAGKGLAIISIKRVTDPIAVIRAIREHAGPKVKWQLSPPRFRKLSGDDVDTLINKEEKKPISRQNIRNTMREGEV